MVIVTTEEVHRHEYTGLKVRAERHDCYATCACGYKGPSRELWPERNIDMSAEARKDHETHRRVEERDNGGQVRWKVRITPTSWRPDISRVVADLDPDSWAIYADERERLEQEMRDFARNVANSDVFKIIPAKGFALTQAGDFMKQITGGFMPDTLDDLIGKTVKINVNSQPCQPSKTQCGTYNPMYCLAGNCPNPA